MKNLREQIAARLLDDLTADERAALDARLADDPAARREFHDLTAMNTLLSDHHARQQARPALEQRLVAGFRARPRRRSPLAWLQLPAFYFPATAAALAVLVTIGALLTRERSPSVRFGQVLDEERRIAPYGNGGTAPTDQILTEAKEREAEGKIASLNETRSRFVTTVDKAGELPVTAFAAASPPVNNPRSSTAGNLDQSSTMSESLATGWDSLTTTRARIAGTDGTVAQRADQAASETPVASAEPTRKLIRNASVELEVARFDAAAQSVADLARAASGYVATQNSARRPNGKMSGALAVKVPPPALDGFLKQLRALGEVRSQTLGTQDVTKAYFDTDARLKNARVMEQRLVELLRDTKGRVSDLLQVERELGRVREQIERMQGELKLWDSLAAFATVNVQLFEKDLNEAAAYRLHERATLALATADVEATFAAAKKVAADEKASVTRSNVTRDGSGNATAVLGLMIPPGASDAAIERLKALGHVLDFRRETERVARDGRENAPDAKVDRAPVETTVTIRSQDQSPTQRTRLRLETGSVETAVDALRRFAAEQKIEIRDSSFSQQPDGRQSASLRFLLPLDADKSLLAQISAQGTVKDLAVERTDAPGAAAVAPRAEVSLTVTPPPRLVADENGLAATLRRTFGQAVAALAWSVRMIGVALAFLAPWVAGIAVLFAGGRIVRRRLAKRK